MIRIEGRLTKDEILKTISQSAIFAHYLGIPEADIIETANTSTLINNPLRNDNRASLGFYSKHGKLRARDFGGYFWGDCFDLVALILNLNVSDSKSFNIILKDIKENVGVRPIELIQQSLKDVEKRKRIIEVAIRSWNADDILYWKQFGIGLDTLSWYQVYPINYFWIDRYSQPEYKYKYFPGDPCYAYFDGKSDNINDIVLYFPNRDKNNPRPRFIMNHHKVQGLYQLQYPTDTLIITKSRKDIMSIMECYYSCKSNTSLSLQGINRRNVQCISYHGEANAISKVHYEWYKSISKRQILFYDNDETGIMNMKKISDELGIEYMYIPEEFNKNGQVKDFSDMVKHYGAEFAIDFLNEYII